MTKSYISDARSRKSRKAKAIHAALEREIGRRPLRFTEPCAQCRKRERSAEWKQTGANA